MMLRSLLDLPQLLSKPQPHVCGNLLIATSSGMQLSSDIFSHNLAQSTLVCGMYIFVVRLDLKCLICPFLLDLSEALLYGRELVFCEDAVVD